MVCGPVDCVGLDVSGSPYRLRWDDSLLGPESLPVTGVGRGRGRVRSTRVRRDPGTSDHTSGGREWEVCECRDCGESGCSVGVICL